MRYDTILFDADGTLFDFSRSESEAIRETMSAFDITPTEELVRGYSVINDSLWKMLERGEIEKQVLLYRRFELFCEKYGFVCDAVKMAETYMNLLSQKAYLLDGAENLCRSLFGNVRLYIVTNGVEFIQKGRYSRSGMEKYFDGFFISGVIGYEKPSVEYFERVAADLPDFDKASTLIVGDSLTSDIRGGINYGIDTCWYNPRRKPVPDDMKINSVCDSFEGIYKFIMGESEEA